MSRRSFATVTAITAVAALALAAPATAASLPAPGASGSLTCSSPGTVSCSAVELDNASAWHGHHTGGRAVAVTPSGYAPAELQQAYNLTAASATNGKGKTVAIVDAYDDPFALLNLATYRSQWGLPPICGAWVIRNCVTVTKVNQRGAASPLPTPDPGWSQEISVDLDTVSAICPNCNILLVEANAATVQSLGVAENTAAAAKPVSIGNSFGVSESASEANADRNFTHPGVAVTAAAGDDGYGVQWPASSPGVVAVGGTTLSTAAGPDGPGPRRPGRATVVAAPVSSPSPPGRLG